MSKKKVVLKSVYNKLIWANFAFGYGFIMLFLALTVGKNNAIETGVVIGNIVCSSLLISGGIIAAITLYVLTLKNGEKSQCERTMHWAFLSSIILPFLGMIYAFSWKITEKSKRKKKGLTVEKTKVPSAHVILIFITLFVILAIWIYYVCSGPIEGDKNKIPGIIDVFIAPFKGLQLSISLIGYLLILGSFLQVINASKSLEAGIGNLAKRLKGKEIILIPILMILFSIGGTTFGMCEETLGFYPIIIPVMLAAGFDTMTTVLVIIFGTGLGVCGSTLNPFCILAAVDASNSGPDGQIVTVSDGIAWRATIYAVLVISGISFTVWYGLKVRRNPQKSVVYESRKEHLEIFTFKTSFAPKLDWKKILTIWIFALTYLFMFVAIIDWEAISGFVGFHKFSEIIAKYFPFLSSVPELGKWGTQEMSMLFLFSTLLIGIIHWQSEKHFLKEVFTGMKDFVGVAMIIAIANGISWVLSSSGIQNILVDQVEKMIGSIQNPQAVIVLLFLIFTLIALAIPSTSGFAKVVFPVVGPAIKTSGLISVSGGITAFSLASGLVNLASPTAAFFIAGCEMSKVPLQKYYKGAGLLLGGVVVISITFLMIGTLLPGHIF